MNHEERCVVYFEKYRTKKSTSDVVKNVIKIRNKKKPLGPFKNQLQNYFLSKRTEKSIRKRDNEKNKDRMKESGRKKR